MIREGGMIKEGYNEDVDKFRSLKTQKAKPGWRSWRLVRRRRKPGIKKSACALITKFSAIIWKLPIPIRSCGRRTGPAKQTLANAERIYYAGI